MAEVTLQEVIEGRAEMPGYIKTHGFWHHIDKVLENYEIEHGVIERADFGRFCHYQGTLVGLSLTIKLENGFSCGWSFENMQDIQELFNQAKATYLKDLIGTPVLVAVKGLIVQGIKVNTYLVIEKKYPGHAEAISFFTSVNKKLMAEQD
ncbi:MAG: hypothetical protein JRC66_08325 [Deltaproteobacteria bacterium]|nr:hypothetical protein [Deltaproteobacteria bacterium]